MALTYLFEEHFVHHDYSALQGDDRKVERG